MKRSLALVAPVLALAALPVHADAYDCFPLCAQATPPVQAAPVNLCEQPAVREVAKLDRDLAPAKQLYSIVTNPTGFALKQVDAHVVHIPAWVGYAIDPRGAIRAKVIERVRDQAKKQVGLGSSCAAEIAAQEPAAL